MTSLFDNQTNKWHSIMTAPRDGSTFEAQNKRGMVFSCRWEMVRATFINLANNHRVNPTAWRPGKQKGPAAETGPS